MVPTEVYEDNASCIAMSHNPVKPDRSRHIDIKKYWLRDMVKDKILRLLKCPGTSNVADALTKSVPGPTLAKHRPWLLGTDKVFTCASSILAHLATFMSPKHIQFPYGSRVPFHACFAALNRAHALAGSDVKPYCAHPARACGA